MIEITTSINQKLWRCRSEQQSKREKEKEGGREGGRKERATAATFYHSTATIQSKLVADRPMIRKIIWRWCCGMVRDWTYKLCWQGNII